MGATVLIGILEAGPVPDALAAQHGTYTPMFERLLGGVDPGLRFRSWIVHEGAMPEAPDAADGWLVTGSKHGVYDPLPWIAPLKAFLCRAIADRRPVAGICFGHQILAEAMGGRVAKSDRGWGLGVQTYRWIARPAWIAGTGAGFAARAIHQDQIVTPPPGATVLAANAFCPFAAMAYGDPDRPDAISLQAHPEFTAAFLDALLEARAGTAIPADQAAAARASLTARVDNAAWAQGIVRFFRDAHARRTGHR